MINTLNINQTKLALYQRVVFAASIMVYLSFYGVLNTLLHYNISSEIVSGLLNVVPLAAMFPFFFASLSNGDYGKLNFSFYILLGLIIYILFAFFYFYESNIAIRNRMMSSYLNMIYFFIGYIITPFVIFFLPKKRLDYLVNNGWIVYVPSILSSIIIIVFSLDTINDKTFYMHTGINRATIKTPLTILSAISTFWLFYSRVFSWKFILGVIGTIIASYGIMMSTSRTAMISLLFVFCVQILMCLKTRVFFLRNIILMSLVIFCLLYFSITKDLFTRFDYLIEYKVSYRLGEGDFSRVDMFLEGLSNFVSHPLGGIPFLANGMWTHFFAIDLIMCTGIYGVFALFILVLALWRGLKKLICVYGVNSYWIILLFVAYIPELIFNGNVYTFFSFPIILILCSDQLELYDKKNI